MGGKLRSLSFVLALSLFLPGAARADEPRRVDVAVYRTGTAIDACALLTSPGDFLLQVVPPDQTDVEHLGPGVIGLTRIKNALNLKPPVGLDYVHAEVVTDITGGRNIVTWSFYPFLFRKSQQEEGQREADEAHRRAVLAHAEAVQAHALHAQQSAVGIEPMGELPEIPPEPPATPPVVEIKPKFRRYGNTDLEYRSNFATFRVHSLYGSLAARERAMERAGTEEGRERYIGTGTCADFVNWSFGEILTSWWNFVPGLQQVVTAVTPMEGISTTDDLADSPDSTRVCEVRDRTELAYPREIATRILAEDLEQAQASSHAAIVAHARWVQEQFMARGILDRQGRPLFERVRFEVDPTLIGVRPPARGAAPEVARQQPAPAPAPSPEEQARRRFLNHRRR